MLAKFKKGLNTNIPGKKKNIRKYNKNIEQYSDLDILLMYEIFHFDLAVKNQGLNLQLLDYIRKMRIIQLCK